MIELSEALQNDQLIIVSARITFKSTNDGGRAGPVAPGYRPNHAFEKYGVDKQINYHIGEIQFDEREYIYPGETALVTVIFLKLGSIERFLIPGQKWFVYEGARLVAEGEILYLIEKL